MKPNRKRSKKMSVMATSTAHVVSVIIVLFVMVIMNYLASSSCSHLVKAKCEKERELARLENEYTQEETRWQKMTTPERLEAALLKHGMSMKSARADQSVRMKADGTPYPGQLSVARAKGLDLGRSAQYNRKRR